MEDVCGLDVLRIEELLNVSETDNDRHKNMLDKKQDYAEEMFKNIQSRIIIWSTLKQKLIEASLLNDKLTLAHSPDQEIKIFVSFKARIKLKELISSKFYMYIKFFKFKVQTKNTC